MDVAQGHELGEPARLLLDIPDQAHVGGHMPRALNMSVHDRGSGRQPDGVSRLDDLHPASGLEFPRRKNFADLVIQNLGRCARQAADTGVHEPAQVVGQVHPALTLAPIDFLGRISVQVQLRKGVFDGGRQLPVVLVVLLRVDASLDTDFGGAALHRPRAFLQQRVHVVDVGVRLMFVPGKAAERTTHVANIGEVHVSADHVGDIVPHVFLARPIRSPDQSVLVGPLHAEKKLSVFDGHFAPLQGTIENCRHSRVYIVKHSLKHQAASSSDWWVGRRA